MARTIKIFDLDGTVIDSSHRHATKTDGSLDLEHWVENSTHEKIMRDELLPLVNTLRAAYAMSYTIVICTARVMSRSDFQYLLNRNIPFDFILSRPKGCTTPDAQLKVEALEKLFRKLNAMPKKAEMWDDNHSVIAAMKKMGIRCHDAKELNK